MKITIYVFLSPAVKAPRKLDRMTVFYDVTIPVLPRVGDKVWLNGLQNHYTESSLRNNPFWLGDGYDDGATVFEVEHHPFDGLATTISVEVGESDSRQIVHWFRKSTRKASHGGEKENG